MGKSSSNKKKTPKYSSQGRAKKKSKTRRTRSKKLQRRDDLVSYSSNDSRSSVSDSSSSEDKYRIRRARSRTRKNVKGTKRRVRSYSSSSEESHHKRKQKGSRRNDDSEVRKRSLRKKKKKKVQRDASITSRSSGSLSCSTCWSSSSSSDESEYESLRGRSERRGKNIRKLKNVKSGTKKRRYKSRSCSSCSGHNESIDDWSEDKVSGGNISKRLKSVITLTKEDREGREFTWDEHKEEMICWSEDKVSGGNISKRLKSVITLTKEDKEGREFTWDEHKEEMIYDHDDYPSSRSNDSNDGGNKSVSAHQSRGASERGRPIEIERREDASVCNTKTTKLPDSYKDGDDQYVRSKPACVRVGTNDAVEEKNNEMSEATGSVNGDDLESILRQKALANLRRFRGGFQTNAMNAVNKKDKSDGPLKSLSTPKAELSQTMSSQDDGALAVKGNSAHYMKKDEKLPSEKNSGIESVSAKNNEVTSAVMAVCSRDKVVSGINKPILVTSALKQALSKATTTATEVPDSSVSSKAKLVTGTSTSKNNATPLSGNNNDHKINNASGSVSCYISAGDVIMNKLEVESKEGSSMVPLNNSSDDGAINASGSSSVEPSSHIASAARDISSNKEQDDGKEGSQLEQKTMSVMRGGEMVQVSYKVYIPKKAPALARRQLKR